MSDTLVLILVIILGNVLGIVLGYIFVGILYDLLKMLRRRRNNGSARVRKLPKQNKPGDVS